MGLLGKLVRVVGVVVLAVIGLGAYLYFTDYEAQATITEKGRDGGGDFVIIRPKLVPTDIRQDIDREAAQFLCVGYQVTYRVQSGHYQVLDARGRLIYDSDTGLNDAISPATCSGLSL